MMELDNYIKNNFQRDISSCQIKQFEIYLQLIQDYNQRINLTTITTRKGIIKQHYIDSLSCLTVVNFPVSSKILDIGSGAGFPGIPLKIIRPDLEITLIESIGKKFIFLEKVKNELELMGLNILNERAEILAHQSIYRDKFDIVLTRALAKLPVATELALPFLRPQGFYLAMLGKDYQKQLINADIAITKLMGKFIFLKQINPDRYIAIIQKSDLTPYPYPRKPGRASKRPLK